jgi:hypothetical protein
MWVFSKESISKNTELRGFAPIGVLEYWSDGP